MQQEQFKTQDNQDILVLFLSLIDVLFVILNQQLGVIIASSVILGILANKSLNTFTEKRSIDRLDFINMLLCILDIVFTSLLVFYSAFIVSGIKAILIAGRVVTRAKVINTGKSTIPAIFLYFKMRNQNRRKTMENKELKITKDENKIIVSGTQKKSLVIAVIALIAYAVKVAFPGIIPEIDIDGYALSNSLDIVLATIGGSAGFVGILSKGTTEKTKTEKKQQKQVAKIKALKKKALLKQQAIAIDKQAEAEAEREVNSNNEKAE